MALQHCSTRHCCADFAGLRPHPHLAACSPGVCPCLQSKRHIKRTKDNPGGIVSVESPLHYSNVSLIDPTTGVPCRVAWRYLESGEKVCSAWEQGCGGQAAGGQR